MISYDDLRDYSLENECPASGHVNGLYIETHYVRVYNKDSHEFHDKIQTKTLLGGKLRVISEASMRELLQQRTAAGPEPSTPMASTPMASAPTTPREAIAEVSWLQYDPVTSSPSTWSFSRAYT